MTSKATINLLFNDICYLFIACFDWKIGVFFQWTVVKFYFIVNNVATPKGLKKHKNIFFQETKDTFFHEVRKMIWSTSNAVDTNYRFCAFFVLMKLKKETSVDDFWWPHHCCFSHDYCMACNWAQEKFSGEYINWWM